MRGAARFLAWLAIACGDTIHVVMGLEILAADEEHVVATWERIFISVWRGRPRVSSTAVMNELAAAFVARSSLPATSLWVVEPSSPPPDDETRKNFATFSRDLAKHLELAVIVAEGGGFRGALIRGVGAALTSILPHRSRFKFADDVDSGAELFRPHLPAGSGGPAALVRVVAETRANILLASRAQSASSVLPPWPR